MSTLSTSEALRSLGSPDAQAGWQTLVERHGPDVWRLILSRSRDPHEAEDVYQDFWMALPRSALSFRPPTGMDQERSARAWLMRVAYTTAIDRVRRRRPVTVDAKGAAMESEPSTARLVAQSQVRPGTEDLDDRDYLVAQVQGALKDLPENYRRPLLLYVVGGLSYEELAADLRCTVNNARVRVHRGLKRLREVLGGDARLNERTLAGLILPVMFAMPTAPAFSVALKSGAVGVGSSLAGGGSVGGTTVSGMGVAIAATGAVAAGVGLTIALTGSPAAPMTTIPTQPAPLVRLLDDFERTDPRIEGHSFSGPAPEISLVPAPVSERPVGGSGNAFRFAWTSEHTGWIDCEYDNPLKSTLDGVVATAATTISLRLWAPGTTRLQHVGVRLADKHGEIFEWRQPLPDSGQTGWRSVVFPLEPRDAATWDKRPVADRVADVPLRLYGYAIAMGKIGSKEGVIIIDDVQLRQQGDVAPTVATSP